MLGTIIKYVGLSEGERYPAFIGHIGYVTSYTLAEKSSDGNTHVEVRWFEPRPGRPGGGSIAYSHFGLDRFEVLSESG